MRIVVPYAAGGPVDTVTRVAAQNLARKWGQQVIVDNRAGSGGALGTQAVVKAPPDAYTLLITNSGPITSYPHMRKSLSYDFERDLAPISLLSKSSIVLVVHPSLPPRSVLGAIPHIKAGKLRALGVSTAQPSPVLPGVPPIAKYYPEFEITSWLGMYAPAGTPQALTEPRPAN